MRSPRRPVLSEKTSATTSPPSCSSWRSPTGQRPWPRLATPASAAPGSRETSSFPIVDREQLRHRSHRQRRPLENVLLVRRTGVSVLRHAALVARVDLRVREEEVDRSVGESVRPRKSLMVILALAAEPVIAHALDGVEIEARAPAAVRGEGFEFLPDGQRGRVRLWVDAPFRTGIGGLGWLQSTAFAIRSTSTPTCPVEGCSGQLTQADGVWVRPLRRPGTKPPREVSGRSSQSWHNQATG
jgi:hypothetical protein